MPTPDYYALWHRLEKTLLELRTGMSESLCVADDINKIKVLQGSWGAYGYVYNVMQDMAAEARGDKPSES